MEFLTTYLGISSEYLIVLAVNLIIATAVLVCVRFVIGFVSKVDLKHELSVRDNAAMGISLAGVIFAVGLIMVGVIDGEPSADLWSEILSVLVSGILGIILVFSARVIFDKTSFPGFGISDEVKKGNVAVSVIDAGNVIATAIIIKTVFLNADSNSESLLLVGLGSFVVSQILLTLASYYRIFLFKKHHKTSLEKNVVEGNVALALRFVGFRLGMAMAISGALTLAPLSLTNLTASLGVWLGISLVQMILVGAFSLIVEKILLMNVDTREEVDNQKNIAVGATQAAIAITIGLIMFTLVS